MRLVIRAPKLRLRRMMKVNPALTQFVELCSDIFGNKDNLTGPSNESVVFRTGLGSAKLKDRGAIRRGNRYPAVTGFGADIIDQTEYRLVQEES